MTAFVIDTETTGLSNDDRVVSLAVIPVGLETEGLHLVFNPDRPCHWAARKVHGLSDDFLALQPRFADHAAALHAQLDGSELIGHNLKFDIRFLNNEFARCGLPPLRGNSQCTMEVYKRRHGSPASLDNAAATYRLDVSGRQKFHGAYIDAFITLQLFAKMILGQAGPLTPATFPAFQNER